MGTAGRTYFPRAGRLLAVVALVVAASAPPTWAQPRWTFTPAQRVAQPGDQVCLPILVEDFTGILSFSAEFRFDSTVLRFDSIADYGALTDFDPSNYLPVEPNAGRVRVEWSRFDYVPGEDSPSTTLPDGGKLFELCFTVVGEAGAFSPVEVRNKPRPADSPDPFVVSATSRSRDIGLYANRAIVTVGLPPTRLRISDAVAATSGDVVCVDLTAEGGVDLVRELDLELEFDPAALTFTGGANFVDGLSDANLAEPAPGRLRLSGTFGSAPLSVPAGQRVLSLCFRTERSCRDLERGRYRDLVSQYGNRGGVRAGVSLTPRAVIVRPGQVDVAPCAPGIGLTGQPAVGAPGDRRCVAVEAAGFSGVTGATFVFAFDPAEVTILDVPASPALADRVQWSITDGDRLTVEVTPGGALTVPNLGQLFGICVEITSAVSTASRFTLSPESSTVSGPPAGGEIVQGGGIVVVVLPIGGPTLAIGGGEAPRGSRVCVPLVVEDFDALNSFRTSIEWDASVARLVEVVDRGTLPEIDSFDAGTETKFIARYVTKAEEVSEGPELLGKWGVNWFAVANSTVDQEQDRSYGESLPAGTTLFELCFEVVGDPGTCSSVRGAFTPVTPDVDSFFVYLQADTPNSRPYPEWCTGDSSVTKVIDGFLQSWCGFESTTYNTLVDRAVTQGWNAGVLFEEGFICSAYDTSWTLRFPERTELPVFDTTCLWSTFEDYDRLDSSRFSVEFDAGLFELVGVTPDPQLAPLTQLDYARLGEGRIGVEVAHFRPTTLVETDAPGGVRAYEFCFVPKPGPPVCAEIGGADAPVPRYSFANQKERAVRIDGGEMCRAGLPIPEPALVITPESCAGASDGSVTVEIDDAGRAFTYSWRAIDGSAISNPTTKDLGGIGPGTYELTITGDLYAPEDLSREVTVPPAPPAPTASLPDDFDLGCGGERLTTVDYSTSDETPPGFRWWRQAAPEAIIGTAASLLIDQAGRYYAEVLDEATGCTALDSVDVTEVAAFTIAPTPPLALDCRQRDTLLALVLDNPDELPLAYAWRIIGEGTVVSGGNGPTPRLTPGTYEATVSEVGGDCRASQTVTVAAYEGWGEIVAEATFDTCARALTLSGTQTDTTAARWTLVEGALPGLDPTAALQTLPEVGVGLYRLTYELVPETCLPSPPVTVEIEVAPTPPINHFGASALVGADLRDTSIRLLTDADDALFPRLDSVDGAATVTIDPDGRLVVSEWTSERLVVRYTVCERACETRCKSVRYLLYREAPSVGEPIPSTGLPNTITPNNDGRNDRFVIDAILEDPSRYPAARLTVINRWGSVLYVGQPYVDQFEGRSNDGAEIPEGTYYYVLEMDVTDGEVLKGSLTILR